MPRSKRIPDDIETASHEDLNALTYHRFRELSSLGDAQPLLMMRALYRPPRDHFAFLGSMSPDDRIHLLKETVHYITLYDPDIMKLRRTGEMESLIRDFEGMIPLSAMSQEFRDIATRLHKRFGPNCASLAEHMAEEIQIWRHMIGANRDAIDKAVTDIGDLLARRAPVAPERTDDKRDARLRHFCTDICRLSSGVRAKDASPNAGNGARR